MEDEERVVLTAEEAIAMLPDGDSIHTFCNPGYGALIGTDWSRDEIIKHLQSNHIELSGETATRMNHGIVAGTSRNDYLFIETRPKGE